MHLFKPPPDVFQAMDESTILEKPIPLVYSPLRAARGSFVQR
jgi:hypothetical protein